jgi:hypothetical protein
MLAKTSTSVETKQNNSTKHNTFQQNIIPFATKKLELLSIKLERCQILEGKFKLD